MNAADPAAQRNTRPHRYLEEDRGDLSLPLFEEELAHRREALGPAHPDTLTAQSNLATAYQEAGALDEAITLYGDALTRSRETLGTEHPDTFTCLANLATACRKAQRGHRRLRGGARKLRERLGSRPSPHRQHPPRPRIRQAGGVPGPLLVPRIE